MSFLKEKDPDSTLDYSFNWGDWLEDGDAIDSFEVTVPDGLTKVSESNSTSIVTVYISGGTLGTLYPVLCEITTENGRTDQRTLYLRIKDK